MFKCDLHPAYRGKNVPRNGCLTCWGLFHAAQGNTIQPGSQDVDMRYLAGEELDASLAPESTESERAAGRDEPADPA